jgi:Tol biopolymer transport system component
MHKVGRLASGLMILFLPSLSLFGCGSGSSESEQDVPFGPASLVLTGAYLGQTPPGVTPEVFAPGIVTTGMYTRDLGMTPDGSEIYFGVFQPGMTAIIQIRRGSDGVWGDPEVAPFSTDSRFFHIEPTISPDGTRFMFLSTRVEGREPEEGEIRSWSNQDIWVMDREGDHWSEPYNLGAPVNSADAEFFPSMTLDGTLYFTRALEGSEESHIYRSAWVEGAYQEPELLGPEVNSTPNQYNAFIAPDESYLILCTGDRDDTRGEADYYVVFRSEDDRWSDPVNLGDVVNTPGGQEISPFVSPDGRYFFFMSARALERERIPETLTWDYLSSYRMLPEIGNPGIYWMDASFIEELRPIGF